MVPQPAQPPQNPLHATDDHYRNRIQKVRDREQVDVIQINKTYDEIVAEAKGRTNLTRDQTDADGSSITRTFGRRDTIIESSDGVELLYLMKHMVREQDFGTKATKVKRSKRRRDESESGEGQRDVRVDQIGEETEEVVQTNSDVRVSRTPLHRRIVQSLCHYLANFAAACQLSKDSRHSRNSTLDTEIDLDDQSVRYYGVWHSQAGQGEGKQVFVAPDTIGGSKRGTCLPAVIGLFDQLSLVWRVVYLMMEVLENKAFQFYQSASKREENLNNPFARFCLTAQYLLFCTVALVANARVAPHRDHKDSPHGFAAMTVLGEFEEGDLYLPRLGIRLAYHPGSVILFKSALLEHTILPFTGSRYAFVLFTHHFLLLHSEVGHIDEYLRDSSNWKSERSETTLCKRAKLRHTVISWTCPRPRASRVEPVLEEVEALQTVEEIEDEHTSDRFEGYRRYALRSSGTL